MQTDPLPQTPGAGADPFDPPRLDLSRIAQDLQIRKVQVESVVGLLDQGNTVPFITRYRKERTGGLNEEVIRAIQARVAQLRALADRKQTILKSIENQGKLTDELRAAVLAADHPKRLEDLYLPYKPKKRTLATVARERGLEPLALSIWSRDPAVANLAELLPTVVNPEKELNTPEDVLLGVQHILAEQIAETAEVRAVVRGIIWDTGKLCTSKSEKLAEGQGLDYKDYFQFTEPVRHIPPHRILAINRGEKENALAVRLECDAESVRKAAVDRLPLDGHPHAEFLQTVTADALARLLLPSLEREVRKELTARAEQHAVTVFARNLRSLLLAPPLRGKRVLAIDPGFRTGCKLACLDETGNLLEEAVIYPHPPHHRPHGKKGGGPQPPAEGQPPPAPEHREEPPHVSKKREEARLRVEELVRKHQLSVIALGNGTACRETEEFISDVIADLERRRNEPTPLAEPPAAAAPADIPGGTTSQVIAAPEPVAASASSLETLPSVPPELLLHDHPEVHAPAALETLPAVAAGADALAPLVLSTEYTVLSASVAEAPPVVAPAPAPTPPLPPRVSLAGLPPPPADLAYIIVNEAGASVYSASAVGREEFPEFDATLRGTISIGRRLQDPLSELVKIDPQNIGVGLYQHDVHPRQLKESLDAIIESCVNQVGVDLNTASVPLLRHVSGLNQLVARELVDYRKQHGPFRSREQLLQVPGIGEARYVQAAGFLKISGGDNPLDRTWIHPESYPVARQLLAELGSGPGALELKEQVEQLREKLKGVSPEEVAARLQVGAPTVKDILEALARPGRDPRDDLPPPIFKKGILKLEDLQPNMELKGTVLNVVDFGAFIDIGLKDSGLVHISQMANRYIRSPYEVVAVGDVVTVWVLSVDPNRRRVSLTMIKPGTERKPPERRPPPPRQEQGQGAGQDRGRRPPRGRRPHPAQARGEQPAPGAPAEVQQPAAAAAPQGQGHGRRHGGPRGRSHSGPPPHHQPPRRPQRPTPKPKLTQAALEGAAPLRTFGELAAFLEAKEKAPKEAVTPVAAAGPEETPPAGG